MRDKIAIAAYEQLAGSFPNVKYISLANSKEPADTCFDLLLHRYVVLINNKRYLCRSAMEAEYIKTLYNVGYRRVALPNDEKMLELLLDEIKREVKEINEEHHSGAETSKVFHMSSKRD